MKKLLSIALGLTVIAGGAAGVKAILPKSDVEAYRDTVVSHAENGTAADEIRTAWLDTPEKAIALHTSICTLASRHDLGQLRTEMQKVMELRYLESGRKADDQTLASLSKGMINGTIAYGCNKPIKHPNSNNNHD